MTLNGNSKEKIKSLKYDILDTLIRYLDLLLLLIYSKSNIQLSKKYHLNQIFRKSILNSNHKKVKLILEMDYK